jgi:hypothetical protein
LYDLFGSWGLLLKVLKCHTDISLQTYNHLPSKQDLFMTGGFLLLKIMCNASTCCIIFHTLMGRGGAAEKKRAGRGEQRARKRAKAVSTPWRERKCMKQVQ